MAGIIFVILLYLALISYLVWIAISIGPESKRIKELTERGNVVTGRVVKLKYIRNRLFIKTGSSEIKVEFLWKGELKLMRAVESVPDDLYKVGGSVELLYLEEYPKTVVVKGTIPNSTKTILLARIVLAAFIFICTILAITGVRDTIQQEEYRTHAEEALEAWKAAKEHVDENKDG